MLRDRGFEVFTPEVDALGTVERRAEQLDQRIPTSGQRVHIIGHSGGGLDARFLVSSGGRNQAHRVASITTICTPHGAPRSRTSRQAFQDGPSGRSSRALTRL